MDRSFPGVFAPFCNSTKNFTKNKWGNITEPMVALGMTSDIFAIFGAIFIIVTYFFLKDLKTRARQFLVIIAFADLFNAIFYLIAQSYFLANNQYAICYANKPIAEIWLCVVQATSNNLFSLLSFSFTIILALHIFFLFYGKNVFLKQKVFWAAIIFGSGFPLLITSLAFWFGWFGPGQTVTIGWCFIRDFTNNNSSDITNSAPYELLAGKLWDIFTFIIISVIYILIIGRCFWKRQERPIWKNFGESDIKLFLIPIAFLVLRIWGEIHLLYSWILPPGYSPIFLYPQAVFEPAQGWVNAIIYVFLTKNVRVRILKCFRYRRTRKYQSLNGEYTGEN